MKECLYCKKEFEPKRESAKYCSVSCRVMYHRKHGKKDVIKIFQMQVLYNQMLEMNEKLIDKIEELALPKLTQPINYTQGFTQLISKPKIRRSFENYQQLINDCEHEDEYRKLVDDINADEYLTTKQKNLLLKR